MKRSCRNCVTCLRDEKRVATCLGFGPRFLHSTGQAYKGGPNSGVILQVTCDDAARLASARPEIHIRRGQGCAGAWRLPGARRTRPPGIASASGQRPRFRPGTICVGIPARSALTFHGVLHGLPGVIFSQSNILHDLEKRFNMEKERIMRLGMVGLGKMGANMTRRLMRGGHEVRGHRPERRQCKEDGRAKAPSPLRRWMTL